MWLRQPDFSGAWRHAVSLLNVQPKRWTVEEYEHLFELGVFGRDPRLELIEGEIVPLSPHNEPHANSVMRATHCLVEAFGDTHYVRCQLPVNASTMSQPEPDFAVIPRSVTYSRHPTEADLIVEVAWSSLAFDRCEKAGLYARTGIPEYWIVNLVARRLERYTEPAPHADAPLGHAYQRCDLLEPGQSVAAHFHPDRLVDVASLF